MAYTGIFTTEAEADFKAGANVSTSITEAQKNAIAAQIESRINVEAKTNYSDSYSTLNNDVKQLLSEIASNLMAIYMISYDMSGFTSRVEAEDMVTILKTQAEEGIKLLREHTKNKFIEDA